MKAKGIIVGAGLAVAVSMAAPANAITPFNVPGTDFWDHPFGSVFDTRSGLDLEANGIAFNQGLYAGYVELSEDRSDAWLEADWDFVDGELFNHKARTAYKNSVVLPDAPMDRELTEEQAATFQAALERLRTGFDRGGRYLAPQDAAFAQVKYDCWIEATEDGRAGDAEGCRAEFESAMAAVEAQANYALTEIDYTTPAPAMAAATPSQMQFIALFNFDSTNYAPGNETIVREALDAALANPDTSLNIVGHADRSGPVAYNQTLSERRANRVIEELVSGGVDPVRISGEAVGETQPLVPTADGVREEGNRAVVINLQ
ncbi:OmpA family protein [Pelagibius sp. CAU 1746]|uniref:OmpA family protein n=1 Tax=Pelagibius sp. CAU 1746 TaxID=3140370 RepID=UPI00325AA121